MAVTSDNYCNAIWIVLIQSILERFDSTEIKSIYYGDLRIKLTGKKTGSQSTNDPLGEINERIKKYKLNTKKPYPFLNSLVVNAETGIPGTGVPDAIGVEEIWKEVRKRGKSWLLEAGKKIGFSDNVDYQGKSLTFTGSRVESIAKSKEARSGDLGSSKSHERAKTWIVPKHHRFAKAIQSWLDLNHFKLLTTKKCRPDFYFEMDGMKTIIEVKPDCTLQSIATAIGQLQIYGDVLEVERTILALPEVRMDKKLAQQLVKQSKFLGFHILPLLTMKSGTVKVGKMRRESPTLKLDLRK